MVIDYEHQLFRRVGADHAGNQQTVLGSGQAVGAIETRSPARNVAGYKRGLAEFENFPHNPNAREVPPINLSALSAIFGIGGHRREG